MQITFICSINKVSDVYTTHCLPIAKKTVFHCKLEKQNENHKLNDNKNFVFLLRYY